MIKTSLTNKHYITLWINVHFKGIYISCLSKWSMYLLLLQWRGAVTFIRGRLSICRCFTNFPVLYCYILLYPICSVFKFAVEVISSFSPMTKNCACVYLYLLNWQVWTDNMLLLRHWQVWLTNWRRKKNPLLLDWSILVFIPIVWPWMLQKYICNHFQKGHCHLLNLRQHHYNQLKLKICWTVETIISKYLSFL